MGQAATASSGAGDRSLQEIELGLGAWAWGDRVVWQFGRGYGAAEVHEAFATSMAEGVRFVDTAEVYGSGKSERLIGEFASSMEASPIVATKFFPWPWRISRKAILDALRGSLKRLSMRDLYLYQVHSANSPLSPEVMAEALVECVEAGLARYVGVSNFDEGQMLRVYTTMARHGAALASNQLHYSLLHRQVEKNGLLARCKELGIRLIAYSPLEMGLLTGKYGRSHHPPGSRALRYASIVGRLQPLLKRMTDIGQDQGGKSNAQIALNWVIAKGALPIPGAKNGRQAAENAGARGWSLTPDEVAALDEASDAVESGALP